MSTKPPADDADSITPMPQKSRPDRRSPKAQPGEAELISFPGTARAGRAIDHLAVNRSLIVRRSLLSMAVGGVVPIPVMDDYLAGRVRAGMLMQIADRRKVDLSPSAAELLADPREGTAGRNATMTAATLLALKLAWRKFFIVLGAGRRAEEMATTFQVGTLFDHFCAKTHVGAGLDRVGAARVRTAVFAAIRETERAALVGVFQEGGRMLGRSIGEAPAWVSRQFRKAIEQYVSSGGNPNAVPAEVPRATPPQAHAAGVGKSAGNKSVPDSAGVEAMPDSISDSMPDSMTDSEVASLDPDARWLDRAAAVIEHRLGRVGSGYIQSLVTRFDEHLASAGAEPQPRTQPQPPTPAETRSQDPK